MTQRINVMYAGFIVETRDDRRPVRRRRPIRTRSACSTRCPRLDADEGEPLIPIEGTPPDQRQAPVGCPFAPRCAGGSTLLERTTRRSAPVRVGDGCRHDRRRTRRTGSPATTRRPPRRPSPADRCGRASWRRRHPAPSTEALAGVPDELAEPGEWFVEGGDVEFLPGQGPTTATGGAAGLPLSPDDER